MKTGQRGGESDLHESFERREEIDQVSNRKFGFVFAIAFAAISAYQCWRSNPGWVYWGGLSAVFGVAAWLFAGVLAPLNRLWMRLALLLSKAVTPLIMAIIFLGTVVPTGFLMRVFGKDPLRLKWEKGQASYWIERVPPGPPADSLKNQF